MNSNPSSAANQAFACLLLGGAAIALSPILIRLADIGPLIRSVAARNRPSVADLS